MLEPTYGEGVGQALDKVEQDDGRRPLWNAIVLAIDLICDHPDSPMARRHAIRSPGGSNIWRVPISVHQEDQDWCLLWAPDGVVAVISYIGPWPPQ